MDTLFQSSPLWIRIGVPYGLALIIGLFILLLPDKWLLKLSRVPCCSPNWITLWGLLIFWIGAADYLYLDHSSGLIIAVLGGCLDRTDGQMSRAMKIAGIKRSASDIRLGKWLDPLFDKLKYLPMIAVFMMLGIINQWIVIWIVCWDVLGTLIRNPINIGVRMWWYSKRMDDHPVSYLMNHVGRRLARGTKAKFFGKTKSTVQSVGLAVCMIFQVYFPGPTNIPNALYLLAAILGGLSVLSRVRIHKRVDRVIDDPSLIFEPSKI